MRLSRLLFPALALSAVLVAACGGGGGSSGGGGGFTPGGGSTPLPVVTFPPSITQSVNLGSTPQTLTFPEIASGASGTVTVPATTSGSGSTTFTVQSSLPVGAPTPQTTNVRRPKTLGATVTPLLYAVVTPTSSITFGSTPGFTFTFPAGTLQGDVYVAFFDPTNAAAGWNAVAGPIAASGNTVALPSQAIAPPITLAANVSYIFAIVENGTPLPTPKPSTSPTPLVTPTPVVTPTPTGTATPPNVGPTASASPLAGPTFGPPSDPGWGPRAVADGLQFPVQSGFNGSGQTVAVVIDSSLSTSDISAYNTYFQTPTTGSTISPVLVDGGPTAGASNGEATLDVETISGLAPGANILIYEIPTLTDQHIVDAYNKAISDGKASVVNSSFSGCETTPTFTLYDPVLQTGASKGIAFVAAAGDTGNECFNGVSNAVGVGYPASDPNVIGVGGTETNLNNADPITNNVAWNDTSCGSTGNSQCATGGGVSARATTPPFQLGLTGEASTTLRNVPDVALPAEDVAIYDTGMWGAAAGTSWSSPEYAALMAEIYEYCNFSVSSATVSFDPVALPYKAYASSPSNFIDVLTGNNQFAGTTPFYSAGTGYDNVSGLGIPLGMPMAHALCPNRVPLSASAGFMQQAQPVTSLAPAAARRIDVAPPVGGLIDQGVRAATATTRIQIVLRPTSSLASDEANVVNALQRAGFTIVQRFSDHLVVDAEAPTSTVDAYFATSLHDMVEGRYGVRYTPVTTATLPAEIAPYVSGVSLDDLVTMHAH
ncbi:MAG: hypothetical protein HKL92_02825 [Candidatus Eremiobacteraeota bacterium]|nr:hypothetical protein [Candidatus Eremiobacteraeota bacterium]